MNYQIVPGGSATGPFWQYRIERDGHFSLWRDWTQDGDKLAFTDDPETGPIRTNVVYWLYARNPQLPDDVPGSFKREMAASVMVLDTGQVVPVGADGKPEQTGGAGDVLAVITGLTNEQKRGLLLSLLQAIPLDRDTDVRTALCAIMATCPISTTPAVITHRFRNFRHYEFPAATSSGSQIVVQGDNSGYTPDQTAPTPPTSPKVKNRTPDWEINGPGTFTKDLESDEFDYDPSQPVTLQSAFWNGATQVATPLPSWLVFDPATRRYTATITSVDQIVTTPVRVTMANANGNGESDYFLLTVRVPVAQPYVTQQVWRGNIQFPEGETKTVWLAELWSDNRPETKYVGGGTANLVIPYPNGVTFTSPAAGASDFTITVPDDALTSDVNGTLQFTFPDGRKMPDLPIVFVNKNSTTNHPPVVANATQFLTANQGRAFDIPVPVAGTFVDPDGDPLTYVVQYSSDGGNTWRALPTWATYNTSTNHLSGTVPLTNTSAGVVYVFRTVASDGKGGTANDPWNLICSQPTTPVISKMAIYLPQGWRTVVGGNVSENVVLLVKVENFTAGLAVQAKYPSSRQDATYGNMQVIDYANNPAPNVLPTGWTHYTQFNDELISGSLKTFFSKLPNISGSEVSATYLSNTSYADHTTTLIYPITN